MPEMCPRLASRLLRIEFHSDHLKNIELWHCLSVFEQYVYGVVSQNRRIREESGRLADPCVRTADLYSAIQVRLDIYYYVLTWDKLSKLFDRLKRLISPLVKPSDSLPKQVSCEFRGLRKKIEHLFAAFHDVRNEYEHPSLQWRNRGNLKEWGTLRRDSQGNMTLHVGKEQFASVQQEHVDRLTSLWVELTDFLLKHFSDTPLSSDLLQVKQWVEDNIDSIIEEYDQFRSEDKNEEANHLVGQVLGAESYLRGEGFPLRDDLIAKFHAALQRTSSGV